MFILYYFLARDEERRMTNQYGASYEDYKSPQRGMFLPLAMERPVSGLFKILAPSPALQNLVIPLFILIVVLGSGFALRTITVHSLPLAAQGNLTVVPILPEDAAQGDKILQGVLKAEAAGALPFLEPGKSYLGYIMRPDYIMQGMIADTGDRSHLFKHHHTVALIVDWVIHPFEHLRRPPAWPPCTIWTPTWPGGTIVRCSSINPNWPVIPAPIGGSSGWKWTGGKPGSCWARKTFLWALSGTRWALSTSTPRMGR
jgi:hypothetical protein